MYHFENTLGDISITVNDLVDAHNDGLEERKWLKAKLADLEDRLHRNNVKLHGVSKTVLPADLMHYTKYIFVELFPDATPIELPIDRIHHLPRPSHLPDKVPRDVLINFFMLRSNSLQNPDPWGNYPPRMVTYSCTLIFFLKLKYY